MKKGICLFKQISIFAQLISLQIQIHLIFIFNNILVKIALNIFSIPKTLNNPIIATFFIIGVQKQ